MGWCTRRGLAEMCRDGWAWQRANPFGYAVVRLANLWLNGRLADQRKVAVGSDLSCEAYRRTLVQPYGVHVQRNSTPTEQEADGKGFPLSRPVHQPGGGVVPLIPCSA